MFYILIIILSLDLMSAEGGFYDDCCVEKEEFCAGLDPLLRADWERCGIIRENPDYSEINEKECIFVKNSVLGDDDPVAEYLSSSDEDEIEKARQDIDLKLVEASKQDAKINDLSEKVVQQESERKTLKLAVVAKQDSEISYLNEYDFAEKVVEAVKHDPTYIQKLRARCQKPTRTCLRKGGSRSLVAQHFGGKTVGMFLLKEVLALLEGEKHLDVDKCAYERFFTVLECVKEPKLRKVRRELTTHFSLPNSAKDQLLVNMALRDLANATKAVCAHITKVDGGYEVWSQKKILGLVLGHV